MRNVARPHDERGQVVVFFAILIPVFLMLTAVVVAGGNWFAHAKHLQTKADAAALAGGEEWAFPCGAVDSDSRILDEARRYAGPHTEASGAPFPPSPATTTFNPQIGDVSGDDIHVVINGNAYWDDDAGSNPADQTSPSGSVCEAKILDVKATEANSFPLASVLPLFPDLKRKARLQIEEADGVTGLLPIAVRIPRPLSAVAVFYNEQDGIIISKQPMREVCIPGVIFCVPFAPAGLGQWTTDPTSGPVPSVQVAGTTGVVIASSFRPACSASGALPPCLNDNPPGVTNVTAFCNQNRTVTCWDASGPAGSQTVVSGVQFIRGYSTAPTGVSDGPPSIRTAYLRPSGSGCEPYVNSLPTACSQILNIEVDLGALKSLYNDPPNPPNTLTLEDLRAEDVEVRYKLARANGTSFCDFGSSCELLPASPNDDGVVTFSTTSDLLSIPRDSWGNAVAIQIRLRQVEPPNALPAQCANSNYNNNCRWYHTAATLSPSVEPSDAAILAAPIQRSFMGSVDRTGPLRWLRLDIDPQCNNTPFEAGGDRLFGWADPPPTLDDAASRPVGSTPCYVVNMGLQGGMARDQDEQPIALLLGSGSSQRALVDCDPNVPHGQVADEIQFGCQWPAYKGNKFDDPPGPPGWCPYGDDTPGTFFDVPKPSPFDDWPAFDCVLTRTTAAANQLSQGFNQRLFGVTNNPSCPPDDASFKPGRNYWHRANNSFDNPDLYGFAWDNDTPGPPPPADDHGTNFNDGDKRLVSLFMTPYGTFTGTGNQVQELVGLGSFYITGYGRITGGGLNIEDPCSDGNGVSVGAGNDPPPDLDLSSNTTVIWGHFLKDVPGGATGGTGVICEPQLSFNPCVPVLVE